MLSTFVMLTQDNYDVYMKMTMTLTNYYIACLFTVITLVIGIYIFLNLFLAILLANLDQVCLDQVCLDQACLDQVCLDQVCLLV